MPAAESAALMLQQEGSAAPARSACYQHDTAERCFSMDSV